MRIYCLKILDGCFGSKADIFPDITPTSASESNPAIHDHGSLRKREESRHVAISQM